MCYAGQYKICLGPTCIEMTHVNTFLKVKALAYSWRSRPRVLKLQLTQTHSGTLTPLVCLID